MTATTATRLAPTTPNGTVQQEPAGTSAFDHLILDREVAREAIYDKIDDPLAFVKEMGKAYAFAGVAGCKTPQEGECLAWALLEMRKNWIEFAGEYHMIQGKPTLQAHAILARMRKAGAKVDWIDDGESRQKAEADFTLEGKKTRIAYSMATAQQAGIVKRDSGWDKNPAAMLRAAMTRKAAKMLCPSATRASKRAEVLANSEFGNFIGVIVCRLTVCWLT